MSHLVVLLVASLAWVVWVPATGLQKLARGHAGSVSVFPVIPMFPLAAWGLAYMFHRFHFRRAQPPSVLFTRLCLWASLLASQSLPSNFGARARYEGGA
jgi:hypothetical protein